MSRAAIQPTPSRTASTTANQISVAENDTPASIPITTPSWAEQGMARASRRIANKRSRRVSKMRVVTVAIVTQPSPSTIGRTALPFNPIMRNRR